MGTAALVLALLALAALTVTVWLLVVRGERSATLAADHPDAARILTITRVGALTYAVVVGVVALYSAATVLIGDSTTIDVPVEPYWPQPAGLTITEGGTATVLESAFTIAALTVTGLGFGTRLLLAGGILLEGLLFVWIAVTIAQLSARTPAEGPFRPALVVAVTRTASIVLVLGLVSQVLRGVGASMASREALFIGGWSVQTDSPDIDPGHGMPEPAVAFDIQFWPIMLFFVLMALAVILRHGAQLQRDTTGLV